jgi:hypothetical protein
VKIFQNKSRLKDLQFEGKIAQTTTPSIRLHLAFELLELAENLYQANLDD